MSPPGQQKKSGHMRSIIICASVMFAVLVFALYKLGDTSYVAEDVSSRAKAPESAPSQASDKKEVTQQEVKNSEVTEVVKVKATEVVTAADEILEPVTQKVAVRPPPTDPPVEVKPERVPLRPLPEGGLVEEQSEPFREWNMPYHAKRKALREEAEKTGFAPFDLHTFYTLDCTFHSLWQVFTLEMTWHKVGQGGFISRVISGCDSHKNKQKHMMQTVLPAEVEERQFGAFFAPTFSTLPNGEYYAPYNRPNAIWYWLNHTDLTEDVFALLDPDMVYMNKLYYGDVRKGQPVSQWYIYMMHYPFEKFECPLCPDRKTAYANGKKFNYEVGPPWMFHIDDLKSIMATWVGLVPMLKAKDPKAWIIEMVAYSVAMAYHNLPHKVIYYGMIDNTKQEPLWDANTHEFITNVKDGNNLRKLALLHYCYTWEVGEHPPREANGGEDQHKRMKDKEFKSRAPVIDYYHFSKYRVPTDWPGGKGHYKMNFLSCDTPLLQEFHTTNAMPGIKEGKNLDPWKRTMYFLDILLPALNEAVLEFKKRHMNCALTKASAQPGQKVLNSNKQLRTSHPRFWISRYHITKTYDTLDRVDFVDPARNASALDLDI